MKMKLLLIVMLLCMVLVPVKAEEEFLYRLANATKDGYQYLDEEFTSYRRANHFYANVQDDYDNLVLFENDEVILMEYGVVEFKVNEGCTLNLNYHDVKHDNDNSINGCYGAEGAYLGSTNNTNRVYFMVSDSIGYTDRNNVILHPYDNLPVRLTRYVAKDGYLYHDIKTQFVSDFYSSTILIDAKPEYLMDETNYFSYDGHYFYDDFKKMIDDYRNDERTYAVNAEEPFFNYFSYLPHRSLSKYSDIDIKDYLANVLFFDRKLNHYHDMNGDRANDEVNRSQYYDEVSSFFANQYLYGTNALMMLSLSINESAFGKSKAAYNQNNLFGHAAFDTDIERESERYLSISSSIYSHAKHYISNRYCNPEKKSYYGSFFGDKNSGMNVSYTSDPYWGEKAASYYYTLDKILGQKYYKNYCLGIVEKPKTITFYKDSSLSEELMTMKEISPYSLIILGNETNAYKIQLEPNISETPFYNFETNVAYVPKGTFDFILNPRKLGKIDYLTITYEANGGEIDHQDTISIKVRKDEIPPLIEPKRAGYEFEGYDKNIVKAKEDTTYVAQYKKIEKIEMLAYPKQIVELNQSIDLDGGAILVTFEDGRTKEIVLTTNMIRNFDLSLEGKQTVTVDYCGMQTSFDIEVSAEIGEAKEELKKRVDTLVKHYLDNGTYDKEELFAVVKELSETNLHLSYEMISSLDQMLIKSTNEDIYYNINPNHYDLSISGLALASLAQESLNNPYPLFKDTYSLVIKNIRKVDEHRLKKFGQAYNFVPVQGFELTVYQNAHEIDTVLPFVIQLKIDDMDTHKLYTVYHIEDNGDVYKCNTMQTKDYIRFMCDQDGSFMIFSIDSANDYQLDNLKENIDSTNSEKVYYLEKLEYGAIAALICSIAICIVKYKIDKQKGLMTWIDYKKSLRNVGLPQEEKPKN